MKVFIPFIILLSSAATTTTGATPVKSLLRHNTQRQLQQDRPCNTQIASLSAEQIQLFGDLLLQSALGLAGLEDLQTTIAGQLITPFVNYGLAVHKVCGSCDDVWRHWSSVADTTAPAFEDYCGANVHGNNATHSALIFIPEQQQLQNNNETAVDSPIIQGNIPSFVHMHSFVTSLDDCPTQVWPDSIVDTIQATIADQSFETFLISFYDFFAGVLIASSGVVSIFPDYIGYGSSTDFIRSSMTQNYAQAAVTSYAATGLYVNDATSGCSQLANVGSMLGLSEGGFGVIPAATALDEFIDIRHVASGAGPLNTFAQMVFVVDAYDNGQVNLLLNNIVFQIVVPFFGFIHSSDLPGLANSGDVDQRFLAQEFQDPADISTNVFQWFTEPDALNFFQILGLSPQNALETLNPNLVDILRESLQRGVNETCPADLIRTGVNDLICPTLDQGNLWSAISETSLPLEICFSPDDSVTSPSNFPTKLFDNPSVRAYEPPIPQLASSGDHLQAQVLCSNSALLAFLANPLLVTPLDSTKQSQCKVEPEEGKGITDEDYFLPVVIASGLVAVGIVAILMCCFCRRK